MAIIDAQVHAYETDHPSRPWAAVLTGPPSANGPEMVAAKADSPVRSMTTLVGAR